MRLKKIYSVILFSFVLLALAALGSCKKNNNDSGVDGAGSGNGYGNTCKGKILKVSAVHNIKDNSSYESDINKHNIKKFIIAVVYQKYAANNKDFKVANENQVEYKIRKAFLVNKNDSDLVIDATVNWSDFWKNNINALLFLVKNRDGMYELVGAEFTDLSHPQKWSLLDMDHDGLSEVSLVTDDSGNGYTDSNYRLLKFDNHAARLIFSGYLQYSAVSVLYENKVEFIPAASGADTLRFEIKLAKQPCDLTDENSCKDTINIDATYHYDGRKYGMVKNPESEKFNNLYLPAVKSVH